jgi:hypothetical protein
MKQPQSIAARSRFLFTLGLVFAGVLSVPARGQGGGFGAQQVITTAADQAWSVYAIDLDGDGDADVLSASWEDDKIAWYENDGSGVFGNQQVITTAADGAWSVYATDLDGDGDADVLSASYADDKIAWYENRLDEHLPSFGPQQVISAAADGARFVYAIDLDGDGDADVLSASWEDNGGPDDKIAWYENDGSGVFGVQQVITTAAFGYYSVYATDLDGDGDADVLSASLNDPNIAWYENDGSGMFGNQQVITIAGSGLRSVYAIDLDGDGDADVLSASSSDDKIAWYENLGGGDFGDPANNQQVITTATDWGASVYATDLDGDGDADVLSASRDDDKIAWYENDGGGVFGNQQVITTAADWARSVYATDLDGDGDADVLSASWYDDKIAWYENMIFHDCNLNGVHDPDDIASGTSTDCNSDGTPDECEIANDAALDCDGDDILDACQIAANPNLDLNQNGVLDTCECVTVNYCTASPNTAGPGCTIGWQGTLELSSNNFTMTATGAPPLKFGVFFYGAIRTQIPLGEGSLCVGGQVQRLQPPVLTDQQGDTMLPIDFTVPPFNGGLFHVIPFSPWDFQFWHRDPLGGLAGFNFSDGLEVTFCP